MTSFEATSVNVTSASTNSVGGIPDINLRDDNCISETGLDYTQLQALLTAQQWKDADTETYRLMLQAVGRQEGDYLRGNEARTFPSAALRTLDGLWLSHSQGRFGFSVQQRIYRDCGALLTGEYPGDDIWAEFGNRTGWRSNDTWISLRRATFHQTAPHGHLPFACALFSIYRFCEGVQLLLSHPELSTTDRGD